MRWTAPRPDATSATALLVALLAVPVLWGFRTVLPLDPAIRVALPLLWLAAWTAASFGAGLLVWSRLRGGNADPSQHLPVVLAVGAAILALIPAVLACVGLLRPWLLAGLFVLAAGGGAGAMARHRTGLVAALPRLPRALLVLLLLALAVVVAGLTAPPVFYDSLNYHLAFPAQWLRAGGFVEYPRQYYSYYPSAMGMIYTYGLVLLGPWAPRALNLWMGVVAALAAGVLARRLADRAAEGWALLLFALTPGILEVAGFAIADLGVAAWGGAALAVIADREGWRARPLASGALLGLLAASAVDAKYLALVTVALPLAAALGTSLWQERTRSAGERRWPPLVVAAGVGLVVLAPWLLRNLVWTGNPFYPYLQHVLGGPPTGMDIAAEMTQNGPAANSWLGWLTDVAVALPRRTFAPLQVGAVLGVQWLLLLPAALLLPGGRRPVARPLWAAVAVGVLGWGCLVQFGRFLIPVLVPMAALAATAAVRLTTETKHTVRAAMGVILGAVLAWNASALLNPLATERLAVAVGAESEGAFLAHRVSYWPVVDHVRTDLPADARILLVGELRSFYLERQVVVEAQDRTPLLVELARGCPDVDCMVAALRSRGVTHVLVNRLEMARIAEMRGLPDYWAEADPRSRRLINDLLATRITERFGLPDVWVGRLAGPGGAPELHRGDG